MMYSEFVENVKCRENDHNYKVFKDLEIMYMNSDMSKAEIYEYGKKLVDNSKTEAEVEFERNIRAEINELKEQLKVFRDDEKRYMEYYKADKEEFGLSARADNYWKNQAKWQRELARQTRQKINGWKWVLGM